MIHDVTGSLNGLKIEIPRIKIILRKLKRRRWRDKKGSL